MKPRREQTNKQRHAAKTNHLIMRVRGALALMRAIRWFLDEKWSFKQDELYRCIQRRTTLISAQLDELITELKEIKHGDDS